MRLLPGMLLALAMATPSTARAVPIFFEITFVDEAGSFEPAVGTVSVDDADLAPTAVVPLQSLDITFDWGPTVQYTIADCGGTAQGQTNAAGDGLAGIEALCGSDPVLHASLDGTFVHEPIENVVIIPGTYTIAQLPEPGVAVLLGGTLAAGWLARRVRGR